MKSIKVSDLCYEIILELSKRDRKKAEIYLEEHFKTLYQKKK
jgi:hypothetical protein